MVAVDGGRSLQPLRIGIAGLGTVARGLLDLFAADAGRLERQAGRPLRIVRVASRTPRPEANLAGAEFSTNLGTLHRDDVDVLVELIGGEDRAVGLAKEALSRRQSVVTANKAVVARFGDELLAAAADQGVGFGFEAAVAGGIPIIGSLTRGLAASRVQTVAGIINGTSNYILTAMSERGSTFEDALAAAQALGYAEADPTFDVEGIDAAQKLSILAALAFDVGFGLDGVFTEGIAGVTAEDIGYAAELGYGIKHLGLARRLEEGIEARVHPTLVPKHGMLAQVRGVMNAVLIESDAAGTSLFHGAGAGAAPTASAVAADLIAVARGEPLGYRAGSQPRRMIPIGAVQSSFYLRIPARDAPGVFGKVANVLGANHISIEGAVQRERSIRINGDGGRPSWVPIVILTDVVRQAVMDAAITEVQSMPEVVGEIRCLRVEHFD